MAKDDRDIQKWVAIELSYLGESKVDNGTIQNTLRKDLKCAPDFPVFVPATTYLKNGKPMTLHLMQGYVFVGAGLDSTKYFSLENQPYVNKVLSGEGRHGMRSLAVITDFHIQSLSKKLRRISCSGLTVGTHVNIMEGLYEEMDGVIVDIDGDHAAVQIVLRSLEIIAVLPKIFLEVNMNTFDEEQSDDQEKEKPQKKPFILEVTRENNPEDDLLVLSIGDCASNSPNKNINLNDVRSNLAKRLAKAPSSIQRIKPKLFQRLEKEFNSTKDGLVSFNEGLGFWEINQNGWDRYIELKEMESVND